MIASIINAVATAEMVAMARGKAEVVPGEIIYTFPRFLCEPLDEQAQKRLEACRRFPWAPPTGRT